MAIAEFNSICCCPTNFSIKSFVYIISLIHNEPNPKSTAFKQICSIEAPSDNKSVTSQFSSLGLNTSINTGASFIVLAV